MDDELALVGPVTKASPWPNLLSLSRAIIAPLFFWTIKEQLITGFIILTGWAILSDFLDGFLARKLNSITKAGKMIDPVADKLCVIAAAMALTIYGDLPRILLIFIVARDIFILLFGLVISRSARIIPVSNWIGKAAVTALSIALLIYTLKMNKFYTLAYWSVILFVIASSVSYLYRAVRIIKNQPE